MTWKLTATDWNMIYAAVQLRAEACEDNEEYKEAERWRKILKKIRDWDRDE